MLFFLFRRGECAMVKGRIELKMNVHGERFFETSVLW